VNQEIILKASRVAADLAILVFIGVCCYRLITDQNPEKYTNWLLLALILMEITDVARFVRDKKKGK